MSGLHGQFFLKIIFKEPFIFDSWTFKSVFNVRGAVTPGPDTGEWTREGGLRLGRRQRTDGAPVCRCGLGLADGGQLARAGQWPVPGRAGLLLAPAPPHNNIQCPDIRTEGEPGQPAVSQLAARGAGVQSDRPALAEMKRGRSLDCLKCVNGLDD